MQGGPRLAGTINVEELAVIHFFGILELGNRRHVSDAEAPNKTSLFSFDTYSDTRDDILSAAEQDALILCGKQHEDSAEERRFTYSLAHHAH
jgi:hypothetical protein